MNTPQPEPTRVLVVLPTWVGDTVMATPALRLLRDRLPGVFLGALARPGVDHILEGSNLFDELHHAPPSGIMAPKVAAQRVRTRRYASALLLTNSFSTALSIRLAAIPRRLGYDRDGRAMLLTEHLTPQRRRDVSPYRNSRTDPSAWAPVPACEYYARLVRAFLKDDRARERSLELNVSPTQAQAGAELLHRAGLSDNEPFCVLNPGGNNPAKRWPADRFAHLAAHLIRRRALRVLINGSPAESKLTDEVIAHIRSAHPDIADRAVALPNLGGSLASLKELLRRAALLVTNDTGPRHIAAAFSTPVLTLFGPTDHRWTTLTPWLPKGGAERILLADPTLPEEEVANDHPDRCRIENITLDDVIDACDELLTPKRAPAD
ncbi:MAG: glycosyltransferase family 9 protein [Phycisphaerales bacterium]